MGLSIVFYLPPSPMADISDDGLTAFAHRDMLDCHLLLAAGPVALQRLHLCREGASKLVEGSLGAVLLGDVLHVREALQNGWMR